MSDNLIVVSFENISLVEKDTLDFQSNRAVRYDIVLRDSDTKVGYCYRIGSGPKADETGNIGYFVFEGSRKKGYGRMACSALLNILWRLGWEEAYIVCDEDNVASIRIVEKMSGEFVRKIGDGKKLYRRCRNMNGT